MNTTGCPSGRFSDQVYSTLIRFPDTDVLSCQQLTDHVEDYHAGFDTCDSDISLLIGGMIAIITIRFLIFLEIVRLWRKARRSEAARKKARGTALLGVKRRLPIVPSLHFLSCVMLSILYALICTNSITARDGTTHAMIILWVTPFCFIEGFALRKLVHLGRRIIPWNGSMQGEDVSKFDLRLRRFAMAMTVLFATCWIAAIVGCFVSPLVFDRISLVCLLIHQALFFSALVYQYERCLSCIRETMREQRKSISASLIHAKRRLQFQQIIMSICGCWAAATIAFYAITLAAAFWAMSIAFVIELVSYGLIALSFAAIGRRGPPSSGGPASERPNSSKFYHAVRDGSVVGSLFSDKRLAQGDLLDLAVPSVPNEESTIMYETSPRIVSKRINDSSDGSPNSKNRVPRESNLDEETVYPVDIENIDLNMNLLERTMSSVAEEEAEAARRNQQQQDQQLQEIGAQSSGGAKTSGSSSVSY